MNYYEVLEVQESAAPEEIRAAYLRLVQQYHPDRHAGEDNSDRDRDRFKQIQEAYEELHDPVRRDQYDRRLASIPRPRKDGRRTAVVTPASPMRPAVRRDVPNDLLRRYAPRKRKKNRWKQLAFFAFITVLAVAVVPQCSHLFEATLDEPVLLPAKHERPSGSAANHVPLMFSVGAEPEEKKSIAATSPSGEPVDSGAMRPPRTRTKVKDDYWLEAPPEISIGNAELQELVPRVWQAEVPSPRTFDSVLNLDSYLQRSLHPRSSTPLDSVDVGEFDASAFDVSPFDASALGVGAMEFDAMRTRAIRVDPGEGMYDSFRQNPSNIPTWSRAPSVALVDGKLMGSVFAHGTSLWNSGITSRRNQSEPAGPSNRMPDPMRGGVQRSQLGGVLGGPPDTGLLSTPNWMEPSALDFPSSLSR